MGIWPEKHVPKSLKFCCGDLVWTGVGGVVVQLNKSSAAGEMASPG